MRERAQDPKIIIEHIESRIVALIGRIDINDPAVRNEDEMEAALLLNNIMSEHYKLFRKREKLLKSYMIALIVIFRARHSDFFEELGFSIDKDEISSLMFGLFDEDDCMVENMM